MTSWIVAIDKKYPQHWKIADEHRFWDMTKNMKIAEGDSVYFWLSGQSLISQTVATSDAAPLGPGDTPPWEDSGARAYKSRFTFRTVSTEPLDEPSWGSLQAATGVTASPHFGPNKITNADGEAWLAARFGVTASLAGPDFHLPDDLRTEVEHLFGEDLRERALREIALRQGQPAFRASLIAAYGGACCITGYQAEPVLEAAHISPYKGPHTNAVTNGLLLRSDIHTLFDQHLLTVTPEFVIRVSPSLADTPYQYLDGRVLATPVNQARRPSPAALQAHNSDCDWLTPAGNFLF